MAKPRLVEARCTQSRMVGDDTYAAGEVYVIDAERAEKYAALGYFTIIGPAAAAKMSPPPENKMMAPGWNKGLPNRDGAPVELDGTPATNQGERP